MTTQPVPQAKRVSGKALFLYSMLLWAGGALLAAAPGPEPRIALVIGNGAYKIDPLSNPVNDARLMQNTLQTLGFEVVLGTDVREKRMRRLVEDFGHRLKQPGAVGLFYYSGHGMQVNGRNYMIPVDAQIRREVDVRSDGVPANEVLWWMEESGSTRNFVILDACRDNPFEKRFKSGLKGLAKMDTPSGTLIAYAASPGAVADQGSIGGNSPFTEVLAKEMIVSRAPALSLFDTVSQKVIQRTNQRQRPYVEVSGIGIFYFRKQPPAEKPLDRVTSSLQDMSATVRQIEQFQSEIEGLWAKAATVPRADLPVLDERMGALGREQRGLIDAVWDELDVAMLQSEDERHRITELINRLIAVHRRQRDLALEDPDKSMGRVHAREAEERMEQLTKLKQRLANLSVSP